MTGMQDRKEKIDFETVLMSERPRLVRLCAWLAGNREAAEDLAQETLIAAWKSREQMLTFWIYGTILVACCKQELTLLGSG